jgi:hypothetical protein
MELEMNMISGFVSNYFGNSETARGFYEQTLNVTYYVILGLFC